MEKRERNSKKFIQTVKQFFTHMIEQAQLITHRKTMDVRQATH